MAGSKRTRMQRGNTNDEGPTKTNKKMIEYRKNLRKHEKDISDNREEIANPSNNIADTLLQKQDAMLNSSKREMKSTGGREVLTDAELFRTLSYHTTQQVENMGAKFKKINASKFIRALKDRQPDLEDGVNWSGLGYEVGVFFKGIPRGTFLCGPLHSELEAKARKRIVRAEKEVFEVEKPMEVGDNENPVEENVHSLARDTIKSVLLEKTAKNVTLKNGTKKQECLDAVEFLADPNSFANTVSNIFDFSMLIKDGSASIRIDEDGLPKVKAERLVGNAQIATQAVVAFSMKEYQELMNAYELQSPYFTIPGAD